MNIIERFIQSKTTRFEECEDGIFANNHYVAVIDGATSKSQTRWDNKRPGKIATDLVLAELTKTSADLEATQFMENLNAAISSWYESQGILAHMHDTPTERCIASIVVYSAPKNQLWFVGDCQAMVNGEIFSNTKLIDTVTSDARALFLELALLEGLTVSEIQAHDIGRDFILPLLKRQSFFQNTKQVSDFSYAVLDGFFEDPTAIKVVELAVNAKEIVLASDGYPVLAPTLEESEKLLQELLVEDPLLIRRYKSTKGLQMGNLSYDDRAYIRLQR